MRAINARDRLAIVADHVQVGRISRLVNMIEYWLRLAAAALAWLWSMIQIYDAYRERKWRSVFGNAFIAIVLGAVVVAMLRR